MNRRMLLMAAAAAALLPAAAQAHGPTRQKVTVTTEVAAEPAEVWALIGNFQDLTWHPAVVSQTGQGGNDIDATRELYLSDKGAEGPKIDEILYKYDAAKMTYSYRITDVAVEVLPVTNYSSHLTVKPREGGGSVVEWRGAFYRGYPNNDPPPELSDEAAIAAVTAVYEAGMAALVERFGAPASDIGIALALTLAAAPAAGDLAFVTCQNGDALSVLDLQSGQKRATWEVPGKPAGVAVTQAGEVYTVSPDSKTVRRFSSSGKILAETTLDGGPIGAAHDAAHDRLFVSDWYNARLWVLDGKTLAVQATLSAAAPAGLDISPDGRLLAVAERDADQVSLFDTDTLAPRATLRVGTRPFGLRFAPDGRLFAGNVGSNDVSVIDPAAGEVLATIPVGERPYGVAFARGRAFVTNQYADTVSVIALDTLAPVATLDVGEYPEGIDATSDGRIAVANWFGNTLSLIDADTLEITATLDTADGPRAFGTFILKGDTP